MAFLKSAWAASLCLLLSGCGGLFYHPTAIRYTTPQRFGVDWRDHDIPRPGGGILRAATIRKSGMDGSQGLIIQFHGNAQNLTAHWLSMRWALDRNWTLVTWDYSGYGESDGSPERDQIAKDADAFLSWTSDSVLPGRSGPVVALGQSLGSAVLLDAFGHWKDKDRTTLLVSEGGFARYRDMGFDVATRHWLLLPLYPLVPLLLWNDHSPAEALPSISPTPLVVVSCSQDQAVPPPHQERIHRLAPGSRRWMVDGCPHIGAFKADSIRVRLVDLADSLILARP